MRKVLFFIAFVVSAGFVQAQDAERIVAKHLEAVGAKNWAKISSIKMQATISSPAAPGMTITSNVTAIRDKMARMDISVMGMNQIMVINGDKSWATNPFTGQNDAQAMTADQVEEMMESLDIDGMLVGYKEKGYTISYAGTEDVNGVSAHKIKVNKGKKVSYSYIDPKTYYEIKKTDVEESEGQTMENVTLYSDFKSQDGVVLPFTLKESGGPIGESTITFSLITFNPKIDDKIFVMPGK